MVPTLLLLLSLQAVQEPGYWQQRVEYDITGRLDEPSGVLAGDEEVRYRNNSPDTLTTISFHLYLNAFRPGSRWTEADARERRHRFDRLSDPDYAYNRIGDVAIGGQPALAMYPFAPDSTIVRFVLPTPLAPGQATTIRMRYEARPSTTPRRQGRRGRRFDFAQWYPRVVTYDKHGWQEQPLYPGGEFYGEFGSFLVALDVAEDQVIGATGVPLCGDPGWVRANRQPGQAVEYARTFYPNAPAARCDPPASGRKRIVWYADQVHHFALSLNPDYRYEGGRQGNTLVHVLYQPGDEPSWGGGRVVGNTATTLSWLDELFGPYPWPQMTVVHRIEGGGTEFPMMQMNGSGSLGLNLHEGGHNYLMGILANKEWAEGWMDEGFTSFQADWYNEGHGIPTAHARDERRILDMELDGMAEPVSLPGEQYRDFNTYNRMVYDKGELFLHQLREVVGEETMLGILRVYYARWRLKHVDEDAFRAVAEELSGRDLRPFFAEWLHGTTLIDYTIGSYHRDRLADGTWRTRVEVVRAEPGHFPVEVLVISDQDSAVTRVESLAERSWVTLATRGKPRRIVLDPRVRSHDWNMQNNEARWGFLGIPMRGMRRAWYLDTYFTTPEPRDRATTGIMPTLWYNDAAGFTIGARSRTGYLNRYDKQLMEYSYGTSIEGEDSESRFNARLRYENPSWWRRPGLHQAAEYFHFEGRTGASLSLERSRAEHSNWGPVHTTGLSLSWVATRRFRYVDPARWDNGGTVELTLYRGIRDSIGPLTVSARVSGAVGLMYDKEGRGIRTENRYDGQGYGRFTAELRLRRQLGGRWQVGGRLYGGLVVSDAPVVRQRLIYLGGADPYETLSNPFLRSRGSLLAGEDVHYHAVGGAGVRGLGSDVTAKSALGATAELQRTLYSARSNGAPANARGLFRRVGLAIFTDLAAADDESDKGPLFAGVVAADAGVGIRVDHRIGDVPFTTRLDFPLYVSHPNLAEDRGPGSKRVGFRYLVSFEPPF